MSLIESPEEGWRSELQPDGSRLITRLGDILASDASAWVFCHRQAARTCEPGYLAAVAGSLPPTTGLGSALVASYPVGSRVSFHPATDQWMQGCKTATVTSVTEDGVVVKPDNAKLRITRFPAEQAVELLL